MLRIIGEGKEGEVALGDSITQCLENLQTIKDLEKVVDKRAQNRFPYRDKIE